MKEAGAYPKKEEVKVSMKAVLKHQNGCHMNQRSDPFLLSCEYQNQNQQVRAQESYIPFDEQC